VEGQRKDQNMRISRAAEDQVWVICSLTLGTLLINQIDPCALPSAENGARTPSVAMCGDDEEMMRT
jgi:hypothetical protein